MKIPFQHFQLESSQGGVPCTGEDVRDLGHGVCVCVETSGQTGDAFPRVVAARDAMHAGTVPLSASHPQWFLQDGA